MGPEQLPTPNNDVASTLRHAVTPLHYRGAQPSWACQRLGDNPHFARMVPGRVPVSPAADRCGISHP
jgi:hypothetical protein